MLLLKIVSYTGLLMLFINVVLYFIGFFKNEKAYKIFTIYLLFIGVIQGAMEVFASLKLNNHFLSTYYLFFQFIILGYFFYQLFFLINRKKSRFIKYSLLGVLLFLGIEYIKQPELYYHFNAIGFLLTSGFLIIFAVLYLYELLSKKLPFYYVTVGIFIYLVSSAFIFASAASLVFFNDGLYVHIWEINGALFIIYQLLILWEWKQQFLPQITRRA